MEIQFATNFSDYVALMAANSPHALVMDLWRRLDLALCEYDRALRQVVDLRNRRATEEAVSLDRALGPGFADCIRRLRLLRNQVAHEPIYHHSSEDAAGYANNHYPRPCDSAALPKALGKEVD